MTRAERIAIRSERVKQRRIKMGLLVDSNVASNVIESVITTTDTTTTRVKISHELPAIIPEGKLSIEICIHTYRYQRRLTFMLSSLLQQKGDVPNLIINISHTDNDGDPTTKAVCDFFREKGLNIVETLVTPEEISNRALARNKQSTATTADWILFADSDMVYAEYFFDDLQKRLKTIYKDVQLVMGADRHSLDDQFCIKYFEEDKTIYPCVIEGVAKKCSDFKLKWITGSGTAAGNFQLISGKVLKEKCGGKVTDRPGDFWRRTKGDRALRIRAGGRQAIKTLNQWHLNHDRGNEFIQR